MASSELPLVHEEPKAPLKQRAWQRCDTAMEERLGWRPRSRALFWHYVTTLWEQVAAIVPISLLQVVVLAAFFQQSASSPGLQAAGLISACVGLLMFLDGLRVCIMPLAEEVGRKLPQRLPLPLVMVVAFCLGVLVTYAEPAIAAIRPLSRLVDPTRAPYLFVVMNQRVEAMVFSVGAGVGLAAVLGTLRFVKNWPLKPIVFASLLPTVAASCYCQWGNPHLKPLLGVAWDLGGVTTGPVTVPILLALGIGVMRTSRQQRLAAAALHNSVASNTGQALEGFGIVTLASLLPVLAVLLMGIALSLEKGYNEVLAMALEAAATPVSESPADTSPVREVIFAVRSISPLIVALLLLVKLVLRAPLPRVSFWLDGAGGTEAASVPPATPKPPAKAAAARPGDVGIALGRGTPSDGGVAPADDRASSHDAEVTLTTSNNPNCAAVHASAASVNGQLGRGCIEGTPAGAGGPVPPGKQAAAQQGRGPDGRQAAGRQGAGGAGGCCSGGRWRAWLDDFGPLVLGVAMCQVGMILFNIGLTYGFTALGDQTGTTLPAAYMAVPYDPRSPYYSFAGGVAILMVTVMLLGVLATNAEPALNVLGATVQRLSNGRFTKRMLIGAVCVGVGVGMCVGAAKILWQLPLLYFILAKYAVASALTILAEDSVTAVAWDSAGVTTGPVTVPFVLSIGIGFSKAVNASEGFGMLTIMSVAPIISVLMTSLLRKPAKAVADAAARGGQAALARVSRGLERTSRSLATISSRGLGASLDRTSRPLDRTSRGLERASRTATCAGISQPDLGRASTLGPSSRPGGSDSLAAKSRSLLLYAWTKAYADPAPSEQQQPQQQQATAAAEGSRPGSSRIGGGASSAPVWDVPGSSFVPPGGGGFAPLHEHAPSSPPDAGDTRGGHETGDRQAGDMA